VLERRLIRPTTGKAGGKTPGFFLCDAPNNQKFFGSFFQERTPFLKKGSKELLFVSASRADA
jgi:hypothetical protein